MYHSSKSHFWWDFALLIAFLLGFIYVAYSYFQLDLVGRTRPMLDNLKTLDPQQMPVFAQNLEALFVGLSMVIRAIFFLGLGCLIYAFALLLQLTKIRRLMAAKSEKAGVGETAEFEVPSPK
jgi:hypothetical protein